MRGIVASIALAAVVVSTLAMPGVHADDPLGPIRGAVNGDRSRTACPPLGYSQALEDAAQSRARFQVPAGFQPPAYNGKTTDFMGIGDPQADAINRAYQRGAGAVISECSYTEFGVGFVRDPDIERDRVVIVFGTPAKPQPTPTPTPAPVTGTGTSRPPVGPHFGEPPTDAVRVTFAKGLTWTVTATNSSELAGTCTYTASGPGGGLGNRTFDIAANGSASFQVPAPLPFAKYHVVTSCHGTFNGKDVEFGHDEQDVSL